VVCDISKAPPAGVTSPLALTLCATLGDRHRQAALHNHLADLLHGAGRDEEAMAHLKQAVKLFAVRGRHRRFSAWNMEVGGVVASGISTLPLASTFGRR